MSVKRIASVLAVSACVLPSAPAVAQTQANLPNEDSGLLAWAIAAGLAVIVLLTGFLNPKRSHLT